MATNLYFSQTSVIPEQNLVQDMVDEAIKMVGINAIYLPRSNSSLINKLLGENVNSTFESAITLEAYVVTNQGFEGSGDLATKLGLQIQDRLTVTISKRRFNETVALTDPSLTKPREGDIFFFPQSQGIFEIVFVEHEGQNFYALGKNYTYQLQCELFKSRGELLNTGDSTIDDLNGRVITGVITVSQNSTAVTGTNTIFTTDVYPGQMLYKKTGEKIGQIESIQSDTTLTLQAGSQNAASGSLVKVFTLSDDVQAPDAENDEIELLTNGTDNFYDPSPVNNPLELLNHTEISPFGGN